MSPADLADLRRQNPKTAKLQQLQQPQTTCLSLRNNTACCIPLRHLRYLRENNTQEYSSNLHKENNKSLADNRRQNPKPPNPKTALTSNHLSFSAK